MNEQEIEDYLEYLMVMEDYKASSRNLAMKAIKFYCREFEGKEFDIRMAKQEKAIPKVCWDSDLRQIMSVTRNIKHRLILSLMRYSGLRKWEAIRVMKHHILDDGHRPMGRQVERLGPREHEP